jgi:hypothetical protein
MDVRLSGGRVDEYDRGSGGCSCGLGGSWCGSGGWGLSSSGWGLGGSGNFYHSRLCGSFRSGGGSRSGSWCLGGSRFSWRVGRACGSYLFPIVSMNGGLVD